MRIILADDHVMFREGMRSFLDRLEPGVGVLEAGSLPEVLRLAAGEGSELGLVLLDLKMPGMEGAESIRRVKALLPTVPVVILSGVVEPALMVETFAAGASGFIPKKLSGEAMLSALRLVLSGERFIPYMMLSAGPEEPASPAPPSGGPNGLTRREREIILLLKEGLPNKTIAQRLTVSEVTVKSHLCSIFRKMGVQNRVQAIRRFAGGEFG